MPVTRRAAALRPRKRPVQARSRATVDAILGAATRLFSTHGYAATTTNHIAERAGVSVGSLYEYFPNKDAILVALMRAHLREGEAVLRAAAADTAGERRDVARVVRRFAHAMVQLHARDRALHRVLFEEAPLPRSLRQHLGELEHAATQIVEAWLRGSPGVTRRDPARAAAVIVNTVEGLTHKLVVHGGLGDDLDAYVDEIVALVTGYLRVDH
jgi:AcrR family transcriptional regulator